MQGTVHGTYRTAGWRQQDYTGSEQGPRLTLAEKELVVEGEMQGKAVGRSSIVQWGTGSSVAIGHVGLTARIGTRSGSFVVEELVKGGAEGATATWRILPESSSGKLSGLAGEGSWEWSPGAEQVSYTLSYRL
jgi:Protein of unknown function (DUF3224)